MAKKEKTLTAEERFQAALVPEEEQPYEIPENWCWVYLSCLASLHNGDRGVNYPSKKEYVISGIPFINAGAIQNGILDSKQFNYITEEKYNSLHAGKIQRNDILYCLRGSLGKTAIVDFDGFGAISSSLCILRHKPGFELRLLYFVLNSDVILRQQNIAENGSAQPNLSAVSVERYKIPLPPYFEQLRIVDRIDTLFAKLDEAKEKAQDVIDGYETRKAAILHRAFTGELTEEWRQKSTRIDPLWKEVPFEDCIDNMQNGISKRSGDIGKPYVVIRLANLSDDGFIIDDLRKILLDDKEQRSYVLQANDILMIRVNGSKDNVGKLFLITNQKEWAFCDHIIRIQCSQIITPQYMVYYSKTKAYRDYIADNMVSSAGQNTISRKGMKLLHVPIPVIAEQNEIVRILDDFISKETAAKKAAEGVLATIETIKQSVLARAFRGELGTNDPNDEPAEELLKRILSE